MKRRLEIKYSALDKAAPPTVEVIVRLQEKSAHGPVPITIGDYAGLETAQAEADRLVARNRHINYVTWWRDLTTGQRVNKWPTLNKGKRRTFRVSVPYVQGLADGAIRQFIYDGLLKHAGRASGAYAHYLPPTALRVNIDADANRVTNAMPTFEEAWGAKVAQGFQYGHDALEQVRFGYELAMEQMAKVKPPKEESDEA